MNMFVLRDDKDKLDGKSVAVPKLFAVPEADPAPSGATQEDDRREDDRRGSGDASAGSSAAASGPSAAVAKQPGHLRNLAALPLFAAAFPVRFGGSGAAFECPRHIADTEALITRVADQLTRQKHRMDPEAAGLVSDLLDDARWLVEAAKRNHETPGSRYDHARAYAKVDVAKGHARAAELIQSRCSQGR